MQLKVSDSSSVNRLAYPQTEIDQTFRFWKSLFVIVLAIIILNLEQIFMSVQ